MAGGHGGLTLIVAELRRHGDDGLLDRPQLILRRRDHLFQHERRNVNRSVRLAVNIPTMVGIADEPF